MKTLLIATTNPGKLREIVPILSGLPVSLVTLADFPNVSPPDEAGATFEDNARLKALYYAGATGLLTVAEDSGLEIDALGGIPGVESARFDGDTYGEKFRTLYRLLDERGDRASSARFVCVAVAARPGEVFCHVRGSVDGHIAPEPRGSGGFGYDPILFYPPFGRTLAELTAVEKSAVSHRGQAFRALAGQLESLLGKLTPEVP